MAATTIFSDFLKALEVPHTGAYADKAFRNMNFKSLFGFSRLLSAYGIPWEADVIADRSRLAVIPTPYLAKVPGGFVIVTDVVRDASGKPQTVDYIFYHRR